MAPIKFLSPKNKLEEGGRSAAAPLHQDEAEPEHKCPNCHKDVPVSRLLANDMVCGCGYHFRLKARLRINMVTDKGSFSELFAGKKAKNPLEFPGYDKKLETSRLASGEQEAVICGTATIEGNPCCLFVMEPEFMMGSMGTAVGERIASLFEYATSHGLPVVGYTVSGGARMQEGLLSLMQMAKTSAAIKRHMDAALLYVCVLTDPTTGGVTASFAMEANIILSEPGALVAFAGPRVIEQTTRKALPKGFQRAEFVLEYGFIDKIAPRHTQKALLGALLSMHCGGGRHE